MPAPEYVEHLMAWVQSNIDNEATFSSRIGVLFPKHFPATLRQFFKRLYRVSAHIYCHHYLVIMQKVGSSHRSFVVLHNCKDR